MSAPTVQCTFCSAIPCYSDYIEIYGKHLLCSLHFSSICKRRVSRTSFMSRSLAAFTRRFCSALCFHVCCRSASISCSVSASCFLCSSSCSARYCRYLCCSSRSSSYSERKLCSQSMSFLSLCHSCHYALCHSC